MKYSFFVIAVLFTLNASAQKDSAIGFDINNWNWRQVSAQVDSAGTRWVAFAEYGGDTLHLDIPSIKYLEIDGIVYEIVGSMEIKRAEPRLRFNEKNGWIPWDQIRIK